MKNGDSRLLFVNQLTDNKGQKIFALQRIFRKIFANKSNLRPIGVGLYQTVTSMMNSGDWAGMFASVVIVFIPTVVIYAFLSDKIISGVTAGGNKG